MCSTQPVIQNINSHTDLACSENIMFKVVGEAKVMTCTCLLPVGLSLKWVLNLGTDVCLLAVGFDVAFIDGLLGLGSCRKLDASSC